MNRELLFPLASSFAAILAVIAAVFAFAGPIEGAYRRFREGYDRRVGALLTATFSPTPVDEFFKQNCVLALVAFASTLAVTRSVWLALAVGAVGYAFPQLRLHIDAERRRTRFDAQLEDALVVMANTLRTSPTLAEAIKVAETTMPPPASQEFSVVMNDYRLGATMDDALARLGERMKSKDLDMVLVSIAVARQVGANLGEMLDEIARTLREIKRLQGMIESKTAEGKMQGKVMGGLPVVIGLALFWIDETMILPLFTTNWGYLLLFAIVVCEVVGVLLIQKFSKLEV